MIHAIGVFSLLLLAVNLWDVLMAGINHEKQFSPEARPEPSEDDPDGAL